MLSGYKMNKVIIFLVFWALGCALIGVKNNGWFLGGGLGGKPV